jgi:agmatinase
MGSERGRDSAVALLGCPLDVTSSFRGGTKFAPDSIRRASWTLETYSPYLNEDLDEASFNDEGNLELRSGDLAFSLDLIESATAEAVEGGRRPLLLGGEHLLSFPALKGLVKHFSGIQVVHFDAHCDLRDEYEGQKLSHATVMKRVSELDKTRIFSIGVRSGTRQEFMKMVPVESPDSLLKGLAPDVPVYITFDMDVFDPSLAPGVTTPEPGGLTFKEVMAFFFALTGMNIVGADIVELSPDYDPTFVSSVTAAKVARELLMLLSSSAKP